MRPSLPRLTKRAFTDLGLWMMLFGCAVGAAFPGFTVLFGVPGAVATSSPFVLSCLGAGLLVGAVNYALARSVVGSRVRHMARSMGVVRTHLADAIDSGDFTGCDPVTYELPEDSSDELGSVAESFNQLIQSVGRSQKIEQAIAAVSTAVARQLEAEQIAHAALDAVLSATGASGGAVLGGHPTFRVLAQHGLLEDLPTVLFDPFLALTAAEPPVNASSNARTLPLTVTPLRVADGLVGLLVLDLADVVSPGLQRLLTVLADTLAISLTNAALHATIRRQASVDELTDLPNRRTGLARLTAELARADRSGAPVGVLLIDVDHFKSVNDTYGHQIGDDVLRNIALTVSQNVRPGDHVCRYGGEELLAVLPGADHEAVAAVAERVRTAVQQRPLIHAVGTIAQTISIGGVSTDRLTDTLEPVIATVDAALYAAKGGGRNRVQMASQTQVCATPA